MLSASSGYQYGVISIVRGVLSTALYQGILPSWDSVSLTQHRTATKKAGGTAKQCVGSHPKHLGMKMASGELAFPGMIIVRQRGTKFHPGQNVGIGRDHTIFATGVGTVSVSARTGRDGKERRFISVEPLPEALSAAAAKASTENGLAPTESALRLSMKAVEDELVLRRAQIKRAILRGSKPLEPALYFNLPTQPDGRLSWLERTTPRVAAMAPKPFTPQQQSAK